MNPLTTVRCVNTDADEYTETLMPRWRLWAYQLFGNAYAKCWREGIMPPPIGGRDDERKAKT